MIVLLLIIGFARKARQRSHLLLSKILFWVEEVSEKLQKIVAIRPE